MILRPLRPIAPEQLLPLCVSRSDNFSRTYADERRDIGPLCSAVLPCLRERDTNAPLPGPERLSAP